MMALPSFFSICQTFTLSHLLLLGFTSVMTGIADVDKSTETASTCHVHYPHWAGFTPLALLEPQQNCQGKCPTLTARLNGKRYVCFKEPIVRLVYGNGICSSLLNAEQFLQPIFDQLQQYPFQCNAKQTVFEAFLFVSTLLVVNTNHMCTSSRVELPYETTVLTWLIVQMMM